MTDLEKLLSSINKFLFIDNEIHSRPNNTKWDVIEEQAKQYTQCRKELQLLVKEAMTQTEKHPR